MSEQNPGQAESDNHNALAETVRTTSAANNTSGAPTIPAAARPTLAGTVPIFQPQTLPDSGQPAKAESRWEPGTVLNGRFRIVALVGAGGMGEVYLADDLVLGLPVALKFLSGRFTTDPGQLAGMYNEVRLGRQVSHPNVCRIYDIAEVTTGGTATGGHADSNGHPPFICMEYIVGENLDSVLHHVGRLRREKAMQIAQELCAGLAAVHDQGLLHRDLKPSNILIDDRGVTRLADFGVAALAQEAAKTGLVGTPGYLPPEVLDGKPATVQSDIYALGLVLFELFSGKPVFTAQDPKTQREEIRTTDLPTLVGSLTDTDPAVKKVVLQCLKTDPAQRPASVRAVAAALAEGAERVRRGRTMVAGALLTLLIMLADFGGLTAWIERPMVDFRAKYCQFFPSPPTDRIVHVDIDDAALEEIGRLPWPRAKTAAIVGELERAGAKVIALDVLYSEPETERPVRALDGSLQIVNDDKVFAETIAAGGNVLIPVHIPVDLPPPQSAVRDKLTELLELDLEQTPTQLEAGLTESGLQATREQFDHDYPFALRDAVYSRVNQALGVDPAKQAVTVDSMRQTLLPHSFATGIKTAADETLAKALPQVVALRNLSRFSLPDNNTLPPMLTSSVKEATTPTLTEAAKYCGFVDFLPSSDGVIRSVPLWVRYGHRLMPQAGLALACAFMGVDIQTLRVYGDHMIIPRPGGADIDVPLRAVKSDARGELAMFMDIPWFGSSAWQTMYDFPAHQVTRQHVAINRVWDICQVGQRIADNNFKAASDVEKVLQHHDLDALKAYQSTTRPSYDDTDAWNSLMQSTFNGVDEGTRNFLLDAHPQFDNDDERDYAVALRNLTVRRQFNADLVAEQKQMRDDLRSRIEGKAVLIGSIASSEGDLWRTPLHVECPGVVIHGVIFNAIVTGKFWRTWPGWLNLSAILCLGLATTAAMTWLSPRKGLAVTVLLAVAYLAVNGVVLFGIWRTVADAAGPIAAVVGVCLARGVIRILSAGGRRQPTGMFASRRSRGL